MKKKKGKGIRRTDSTFFRTCKEKLTGREEKREKVRERERERPRKGLRSSWEAKSWLVTY